MTDHVYIKSEPELWTVGFYDPKGVWHSESDHSSRASAANKVHFLNGGSGDTFILEPAAPHTRGLLQVVDYIVILSVYGLGITPIFLEVGWELGLGVFIGGAVFIWGIFSWINSRRNKKEAE